MPFATARSSSGKRSTSEPIGRKLCSTFTLRTRITASISVMMHALNAARSAGSQASRRADMRWRRAFFSAAIIPAQALK
ncbi:MAG: hypothetical protein IPO60_12280 [Flavobacteriales bacterium]|nr:hypothetical protein [Flavobacteriales bacterium]